MESKELFMIVKVSLAGCLDVYHSDNTFCMGFVYVGKCHPKYYKNRGCAIKKAKELDDLYRFCDREDRAIAIRCTDYDMLKRGLIDMTRTDAIRLYELKE